MSLYTRGIRTIIRHGYIEIYEYLYLGILTPIRVDVLFISETYLELHLY